MWQSVLVCNLQALLIYVAEESALGCGGKDDSIQKELYNLTINLKTYKRETETLRQVK